MQRRKSSRSAGIALTAASLAAVSLAESVRGDIYRWDNGQVIPGTEGITPGPNLNFPSGVLEYAEFGGADLVGAMLESSDLFSADFSSANLTGANLGNADVSGVLRP
jgi:uncharacterized protein YjbI with pentapeptide repeats